MTPTTELWRLERVIRRRLRRLRGIARLATWRGTPEDERALAFVTVELLSSWSEFVRAYYLSCVIGARTNAGVRIKHALPITTIQGGLDEAIVRLRPSVKRWRRRDEPTWHDTHTLLTLGTHFKFSNIAQVATAFALGTRVFGDLPRVRNFYAHRNHHSAATVRNLSRVYGVPFPKRPSNFLMSRAPGRPRMIVEDWMDDIDVVTELLCA